MTYDLFNFIFFFSLNKLWGWCREVLAVDLILTIRGEKGSVEYIVDFPSFGESELVDNRG
jgi:hypothetical protein